MESWKTMCPPLITAMALYYPLLVLINQKLVVKPGQEHKSQRQNEHDITYFWPVILCSTLNHILIPNVLIMQQEDHSVVTGIPTEKVSEYFEFYLKPLMHVCLHGWDRNRLTWDLKSSANCMASLHWRTNDRIANGECGRLNLVKQE